MTASSFGFLSGFGIRIPVLVRVLRGKNIPCSSLRVFQDLCGKKFPGLCNRKCCTHLRTRLCSHLRCRKPLILLICHACHGLKPLLAGGSPEPKNRPGANISLRAPFSLPHRFAPTLLSLFSGQLERQLASLVASLGVHKNPYKIRLWPAWQDRKALAGGPAQRSSPS